MLYKFELGYNTVEVIKKICCSKSKGSVDHSSVTRWFKKFCNECKNIDNQAKSDIPKIVHSKAMFQD